MSEHTSPTLENIKELPKTACASCPNAVWQVALIDSNEELRVFCQVMGSLLEEHIEICDGVTISPPQTNAS